jgi:ABC-type bacteriocin/lantibiotic exporter with double-glycine peptidase domain
MEEASAPFNTHGKNTLEKITPVMRFWRYIKSEKKDIWIIYVYALVVGLIGLSLPLGIQAVIQMISGGILYDTAMLIIILVLLGVAATGGLQVMQIYMVEVLQRRLFAKATFEFAYRLPRIKADDLQGSYPPEVVNRFFDVVLLQKGISKILVELTAALLQVLFGLLLLAIYHPSFIVFDMVFVTAAYIVFRFTGKKGLDTSIKESSYKYKMMAWLQEIARNLSTFKLSTGQSNFVQEKTDAYTIKYLNARKSHFRVLLSQYINILIFKIAIIGATLILGSLLVVDRQINLGQFVATEIIIVLILGAIEKIIISVDTVYDAFTSIEKIAKISDYPFEENGSIKAEDYSSGQGLAITLNNISYTNYTGNAVLKNITLDIASGSVVAFTGNDSYATDALISIISGIYQNYNGSIKINNIAIKDLDHESYRSLIAHSMPNNQLFEGSVLDNITMGNKQIEEIDVVKTLNKLGVYDALTLLPSGLHHKILPGGIGLPEELCSKILVAKNVLKKPKLWITHEYCYNHVAEALKLFKAELQNTTIIVVGNNEQTHQNANTIYVVEHGSIAISGTYAALKNNDIYKKQLNPVTHA